MDARARMDLWEAFSDFFLDTELDEITFQHAARVVRRSGATRDEAEGVLWNEVFPVLYWNPQSVAGEWAGRPREWLVAHIRPSEGPARKVGPAWIVQEVEGCWEKVLEHLGSHA
ncbi:hypothetical protein [Lysobacter sp. TY2-98]|uniref:DUF7079 family protein n=1 Tax=Lysobacter sp. TY2-98 TaxID=2290922 RepID=UPI0013B3DFA5|nr:hypothetical protein [Lysobacter sp. TY2-98]